MTINIWCTSLASYTYIFSCMFHIYCFSYLKLSCKLLLKVNICGIFLNHYIFLYAISKGRLVYMNVQLAT